MFSFGKEAAWAASLATCQRLAALKRIIPQEKSDSGVAPRRL
jgi:hypothetical protein